MLGHPVRNLLLGFVILITPAAEANAQGISLRANIGLMLSQIRTDYPVADPRTGLARLNLGLSVSPPDRSVVGFQPEVSLGWKGNLGGGAQFRFTYVDVPLLVRVNFLNPVASRKRPYIVLGPSFNFLLSAAEVVAFGQEKKTGIIRRDDIGFVVGGGLTNGRLGIEARVQVGLVNVLAEPRSHLGSIKNTSLSILVTRRIGR